MVGKLNRKLRNRRRGFTLIELLVVVLILAILMSVALPLYLSAVADSEKKSCRANLQTISNAVQAAKVRTRATAYFTGTVNAAACDPNTGTLADLQSAPICPNAGIYSVAIGGTGPYTVSCSIATHGSFTPGVDSQ